MKEKMDRFVDAMFVVWFLVLLVVYCGAGAMQVSAAEVSEAVKRAEISESTEHTEISEATEYAESLTVETPEIKMPEIPAPGDSETSEASDAEDEEYLRKYFREPLYTVGINTTGTKYKDMSMQQFRLPPDA